MKQVVLIYKPTGKRVKFSAKHAEYLLAERPHDYEQAGTPVLKVEKKVVAQKKSVAVNPEQILQGTVPQILPRLEELSSKELEIVKAYEKENKNRKTILGYEQLN